MKPLPADRRVLIALVLLAAAVVLSVTLLRPSHAARAQALFAHRVFICAQTGRTFEVELRHGDRLPVPSPYSGGATGFPAEPCFWTAQGQVKDTPTWVLLHEYAGRAGPTYCPDCGRLVVPHNPPATASGTPPPKAGEAPAPARPARRNP